MQRLPREAAEEARRRAAGRRPGRRPADARRRPCAPGSGGCARSRAGTRPAPPRARLRPEALEHPRPRHRRLAGGAQHRHALAVARVPADAALDPQHAARLPADPGKVRQPRIGRVGGAARPPRGSAARGRAPRTAPPGRWCATSDFATTSRPEVSLSIRCTIPGRSRPPIPESVPPQWCSSAFTSVPSGAPGRGMHHEARRLVDDDEIGVLVDDVERDRLGRRAPIGPGAGRRHAPPRSRARASAAGRRAACRRPRATAPSRDQRLQPRPAEGELLWHRRRQRLIKALGRRPQRDAKR